LLLLELLSFCCWRLWCWLLLLLLSFCYWPVLRLLQHCQVAPAKASAQLPEALLLAAQCSAIAGAATRCPDWLQRPNNKPSQ
jgi:hypothetical protein